MKIVFRLILLAALLALGVWLWFVLFPSPEKIIRQRLTELARTASFSSGESDLAQARRRAKSGRLFRHQRRGQH